MFKLSDEGLKLVQKELTRYESKRSAILPCLYLVQKENKGGGCREMDFEMS